MTTDAKTLKPDGAWVAEVRPTLSGSGFDVVSRTRVLDWVFSKDGHWLPITAYGRVDPRAFWPNHRASEQGFSLIEYRDGDGARKFLWPTAQKELTDFDLRQYMVWLREHRDETRDHIDAIRAKSAAGLIKK